MHKIILKIYSAARVTYYFKGGNGFILPCSAGLSLSSFRPTPVSRRQKACSSSRASLKAAASWLNPSGRILRYSCAQTPCADDEAASEVDAEAVRRGETRSFANQDRHRAGFQGFANIIPQRHPRLMRQHHRRRRYPASADRAAGRGSTAPPGALPPRREAVADHQQQVGGADAAGGEVGATLIGELPPEIRAPQIGMTVRRGAVHRQGLRPSAASGATNCWLANG